MSVSILLAVLWGLLWVLVGLLGLVILLLLLILFLPFDIQARLDSDWAAAGWNEEMAGAARWAIRLRWGRVVFSGIWEGEQAAVTRSEVRVFGLRWRFGSKPGRGGGHAGQKIRQEPGKKPRSRKKSGMDQPLLIALAQEAARFLQRLVRSLGFRIAGDLTYGFPDPALTGWCEAIRWSARIPLPVRLEPEFTHPALTGWAQLNGKACGYQIVGAAWRALDHPVIRERLAEKIHFGPIRSWLLRGGKRVCRTSS